MNKLLRRWSEYWFTPEQPGNLGLCRALFFGSLFLLYLGTDWSEWSYVSRSFWFPITLFKRLHLPVFDATLLAALGVVWKLSLLSAALGLFTRGSSIVVAVLGLYLLGLPHNFGKTHHFDAMIVLISGLLALSRAGDAYSLDRYLRARKSGAPPAPASGEYRWPIRAAWVVMALVFFSAGFEKLRHGGLAWMFSDNMSVVLLQHGYQVANEDPPVRLGLWFAQYPALCSLLAVLTIVVEAGYPLALFWRPARWFFPAAMCGTLVGIHLMMGPTFPQFVLCHLFWVPWDRLLELARSRGVNAESERVEASS